MPVCPKTLPRNRGNMPVMEQPPREVGSATAPDARTRQFARRQETWFRALSECTPVPLYEGMSPGQIADTILSLAMNNTNPTRQ